MVRQVLSVALTLLLVCGAKEQASDGKNEAKIRELTAELKALKEEMAECKTNLVNEAEDSYVTVEDIMEHVDVAAKHLGVGDLDVNAVINPVVEAANKGVKAVDINVTQLIGAMSVAYDKAYKAVTDGASVLQEQHDQHVLPHAGEYYGVAKPHLEVFQKAVLDAVGPQLALLKDGVGTAHTGFREKLKTLFEQFTLSASAQLSGVGASGILKKMYEKRDVDIMGWRKTFTHGYLDIILFLVQTIVNLYVLMLVIVQLWSYIVKLGFKLGFKMVRGVGKGVTGITSTTATLAFRVVFFFVSMLFIFFMLAVFCALALSLVHGIHSSAKLGMDPSLRLAVGLGVGLVFFLPIYCCCCCRKKRNKKAESGKSSASSNGKASTPAAKKDSTPKAKADSKASAKKPASKK